MEHLTEQANLIDNNVDAIRFITSGKAIVTFHNTNTGNHFTYKITRPDEEKCFYFVAVLTGPDNWSNYTPLGFIRNDEFTQSAKYKIGKDAVSYKAFEFVWSNLLTCSLPPAVEIWHEGKCGRCGRKLTTPESVERGIGPECWEKIGG